jgi:hypothetical protein
MSLPKVIKDLLAHPQELSDQVLKKLHSAQELGKVLETACIIPVADQSYLHMLHELKTKKYVYSYRGVCPHRGTKTKCTCERHQNYKGPNDHICRRQGNKLYTLCPVSKLCLVKDGNYDGPPKIIRMD